MPTTGALPNPNLHPGCLCSKLHAVVSLHKRRLASRCCCHIWPSCGVMLPGSCPHSTQQLCSSARRLVVLCLLWLSLHLHGVGVTQW
jgi:hypothetical protein